MEGLGLYVQYIVGDEPCANCVMVRAYLFLLAFSGMIAIVTAKPVFQRKQTELLRLTVIFTIAMTGLGMAFYHSYDNYLVESGQNLFATCGLESPFPIWLPLDQWLPALFELKGLCGTPAYLFEWLTFTELSMIGLPLIMSVATLLYLNAMWISIRK